MKVILTESVESMGQIGDMVNVAPGYARNYLFPQKLAMEATGKNVRELDHKKRVLALKGKKCARRCSPTPRSSMRLPCRCAERSRRKTSCMDR